MKTSRSCDWFPSICPRRAAFFSLVSDEPSDSDVTRGRHRSFCRRNYICRVVFRISFWPMLVGKRNIAFLAARFLGTFPLTILPAGIVFYLPGGVCGCVCLSLFCRRRCAWRCILIKRVGPFSGQRHLLTHSLTFPRPRIPDTSTKEKLEINTLKQQQMPPSVKCANYADYIVPGQVHEVARARQGERERKVTHTHTRRTEQSRN